ncbi:MAG TPA: hypothetical protein VI796_03835, partial [Candidatus Thermoplasmatota archaeon]|nr:hypothetical protein [Candidatus Thermoplasmatota archaeon]
MAILRRTRPSPVPGAALQHVKGYLSPHYGSDVIEGDEGRTLVIRVPRPDPDVVNDMEAAVEHLDLPDLKDVVHCLLLGENRTLAVAPAMLRELMTRRLEYDHRQTDALRRELTGPWQHSLYRAADDPRRYWRLGVRLPHAHVRDLAAEDIEAMADLLGPQLGDPNLQQAVAVYLVAGEDDVRLDPDLFLQDLRSRYDTEARALEEEAARLAAEEANRRRREEEHQAVLAEMALRFRPTAARLAPPSTLSPNVDAHPHLGLPGDADLLHR